MSYSMPARRVRVLHLTVLADAHSWPCCSWLFIVPNQVYAVSRWSKNHVRRLVVTL
jgi:hypothetical protein